MKKRILVWAFMGAFVCLLAMGTLSAHKKEVSTVALHPWGYGLSFAGASRSVGTMPTGKTSYEAVFLGSFFFAISPWDLPFLNPSLRTTLSVGVGSHGVQVHDASAVLGIEIIRTLNHPLGFMVTNKAVWAPSLTVGGSYLFGYRPDAKEGWHMLLEASPLKLSHRDFVYEWLVPYAHVDVRQHTIAEWGIVLYRGTVLI